MLDLSRRALFGVPIITGLLAHPAAAAKLITPSLIIDDPLPNVVVEELNFPIYALRVRYNEMRTDYIPPSFLEKMKTMENVQDAVALGKAKPTLLEGKPGGSLSIQIVKHFHNEMEEFGSVREFFGLDSMTPSPVDPKTAAWSRPMAVSMNSHAVRIAGRTRRGVGNVVVISHDSLFPSIAAFKELPYWGPEEEGDAGSTIFARSSALKRDEMLIMYVGQDRIKDGPKAGKLTEIMDGPFRGELLPNGGVRGMRLQNQYSTMGNWQDYVSYLKIA